MDLFVQDKQSRLRYYENTGSIQQPQWQWRSDYFAGLDIGSWFRFADIDNDQDFDLFCESPVALIRIYRNTGPAAFPNFELAADTLRDTDGGFIEAEITNIPEIADLDCDGDPDLLLGRQSGYVAVYENSGNDVRNLPRFVSLSDTFQGIFIYGDHCNNAQFESDKPFPEKHGANALTLVDIDGDYDSDLFWGDFFSCSLYFLQNSGDCGNPSLSLTLADYPPAQPVGTGGYNVPQFTDIDGDSDPDLFIGVQGGLWFSSRDLVDNFLWYENQGDALSPFLILNTSRFLYGIDFGEKSAPAFVDIDADGDWDLFVGNETEPGAGQSKRLHFFENISSSAGTSYSENSAGDILLNNGFNYSPAFTDIDGDQDFDLFLGDFFGNLQFYENTGTRFQPQFEWRTNNFQGISGGQYTKPVFADIDADNDPDLFLGTVNGDLRFFRNRGDSASAGFTEETQLVAAIRNGSFSAPELVDLDGDGDLDILVGSQSGSTAFFENTGTETLAQFSSASSFSINGQFHSVPRAFDADNDGDIDLLCGSSFGGMLYFENRQTVNRLQRTLPQKSGQFHLDRAWPNPFNPAVRLQFNLYIARDIEFRVYDLSGRTIHRHVIRYSSPGLKTVSWDGTDFSSGIYFLAITAGLDTEYKKVLLVR